LLFFYGPCDDEIAIVQRSSSQLIAAFAFVFILLDAASPWGLLPMNLQEGLLPEGVLAATFRQRLQASLAVVAAACRRVATARSCAWAFNACRAFALANSLVTGPAGKAREYQQIFLLKKELTDVRAICSF